MTHNAETEWCARADSEAVRFSLFSLSSLGAGESGRMRENQNAILPLVCPSEKDRLQRGRENRENDSPSYTCAGAARVNRKLSRASVPPYSPDPPSHTLWAALINREDIYAIACRLGLPPADPVDAWRLAILRIARSEDFMDYMPPDVPVRVEDWVRWWSIEASPRKLLGLLRKLIYGVRIWD